MLSKTITYTDYNDVERTETFHFNLTESELLQKELGSKGSYAEMLDSIVKAKDKQELAQAFKELIKTSYGVKSEDGKRFMKKPEYWDEFEACPAFDVLYLELATDDNAAIAFVNGILPKKMRENLAKQLPATDVA